MKKCLLLFVVLIALASCEEKERNHLPESLAGSRWLFNTRMAKYDRSIELNFIGENLVSVNSSYKKKYDPTDGLVKYTYDNRKIFTHPIGRVIYSEDKSFHFTIENEKLILSVGTSRLPFERIN